MFIPWLFSSTSAPTKPSLRDDELLNALRHYEVPGAHPPDSRVDPYALQTQAGSLFTIRSIFKLGFFLAIKSREVATDILTYNLYGPKRPTWGIEMTIITSLVRNITDHGELINLVILRSAMAIMGFVPTPSDALVTSVTYQVKRRNLPGILAEFDELEDGTRELTGEWIVGRRLWMKMQHEWSRSHDGNSMGRRKKERVILYLHGGGYYTMSAATHRPITIRLSKVCGVRVFAVNYRLAPETRFPGPLLDATSAYFRLIDDLKIPPENIVIAGDSAGGGLCLGLLMYLRDHKLPLPGGAILLSPWVDLTMSCASWETNAEYDVCPLPRPNDHLNPVYCYIGEEGLKRGYATHPYASPLFGDFKGLPPMLIQSGEAEVFRDEITLLAFKARRDGVEAVHELYQDAVHVFQAFPFLAIAQQAYESCREFMNNVLPTLQAKPPQTWDDDGRTVDEEIGINDEERVMVVDGAGAVTGEGKEAVEKAEHEQISDEELTPPSNEYNTLIQEDESEVEEEDEPLGMRTPRRRPSPGLPLDDVSVRQRRRSQIDGTSVDGKAIGSNMPFPLLGPSAVDQPQESSAFGPHSRVTSNRYVTLPRSKSSHALLGFTPVVPPPQPQPQTSTGRRHTRQASMHAALTALPKRSGATTPIVFKSTRRARTAAGDGFDDADETEEVQEDFFAYASRLQSATPGGTPAPSVRLRNRTSTMRSEVDDLCREWLKMNASASEDVAYWPTG
ncbi:hypothetical protein FRB94_001712 [Tulasnella sp. JGI-2019a]|nr:hypothetical protein FRB94_001712 [Tulasnella sp. JGI-2019a]